MASIAEQLVGALTGGNMFWVIVGVIAVVAVVFGTVSSMVINSQRERTKREIAAYIAEGSMTPEQGEKILKANSED